MSVDILIAEKASCGLMKIPIHFVTSYAFYEEFVVFFGRGFMSVCIWWFIFTSMILKFRV